MRKIYKAIIGTTAILSAGATAVAGESRMSEIEGTYAGTFWCDFGEMGMTLSIKDAGKPDDSDMAEAGIHNITGVLNFFPTLVNPSMPTGAFKVSGWVNAGGEYVNELALEPGDWINQPDDFGASPMEGRLINNTIYGKPTVDGCHQLQMEKLAE